MNKTILILMILLASTASLSQINCEKLSRVSQSRPSQTRLRAFGLPKMKPLYGLNKAYKVQDELNEAFEKLELYRKHQQIMKEEMEQRRIYQKFLGDRVESRSFLKDFHTNRFF
jgi:hypothetical protein